MNVLLGTPNDDAPERVFAEAVEAEARRRRAWRRASAFLLFLPLAGIAAFLVWGRSDEARIQGVERRVEGVLTKEDFDRRQKALHASIKSQLEAEHPVFRDLLEWKQGELGKLRTDIQELQARKPFAIDPAVLRREVASVTKEELAAQGNLVLALSERVDAVEKRDGRDPRIVPRVSGSVREVEGGTVQVVVKEPSEGEVPVGALLVVVRDGRYVNLVRVTRVEGRGLVAAVVGSKDPEALPKPRDTVRSP